MSRRIPALALLLAALASRPIHGSERIYVTLGNNSVVSYDVSLGTSLDVQNSAQTFATANINNPMGLAFDAVGNLYVASLNSNQILKYDNQGTYQSVITSNVQSPCSVAFNAAGNLSVANSGVNTISTYTPHGAFVSSITGNLYAANFGNSTVSKFNSAGVFQFSWPTADTARYVAFTHSPIPVPEPGGMIPVLAALGSGWWFLRRRLSRAVR